MTNKEKMLSGLLKGAIIAAGTGVGLLLSKCFSVEAEECPDVGEPNEPEKVIEGIFVEMEGTEEV